MHHNEARLKALNLSNLFFSLFIFLYIMGLVADPDTSLFFFLSVAVTSYLNCTQSPHYGPAFLSCLKVVIKRMEETVMQNELSQSRIQMSDARLSAVKI